MIKNEDVIKEINQKYSKNYNKCVADAEMTYENIDLGDIVLNGTYRYRSFELEYSNIYTIDDGVNILSMTTLPVLPAYVLQACFSCTECCSGNVAFKYFLKDEYSKLEDNNVRTDSFDLESIGGFSHIFDNLKNISVQSEHEFASVFYPEDENKVYKNYLEFENEIKVHLDKLGFEYDSEFADDEYDDFGYEDRETFLSFMDGLSVEELNQFIRGEYEGKCFCCG